MSKSHSGDLMTKGDQGLSPRLIIDGEPDNPAPWPDPTPEMLTTPEFEAVWQCIKRWDVNVPNVYAGYSGATGNHVRAILDALKVLPPAGEGRGICECPTCGRSHWQLAARR